MDENKLNIDTAPLSQPMDKEQAIESIVNASMKSSTIDLSGVEVKLSDYKDVIESCRQVKDLDVILNGRLGAYNMYGEYILDGAIRQELLDMPKIIYSTSFDDESHVTTYEIRGMVPVFGDIFFVLTIGEDEAVFYLVEEIRREEANYTEIAREVVDIVPLDPDNRLPEEYIFQMYNILRETMDDGAKEIRFACENILIRKIYMTMLAEAIYGKEDVSGNDMVGQAMELFRQSGALGAKVLTAFAVMMSRHPEINHLPTKAKYDKAVFDMLLACLDEVVTKEDLQDEKTKELYSQLRFLRYKSIKYQLEKEILRLDEKFVIKLANKINQDFVKKDKLNLEKDKQYVLSLSTAIMVANNHKSSIKRHKPVGPILKQNKKSYEKDNILNPKETKEEKILKILAKSEQNKEQTKPADKKPTSKKVSPAKKSPKKLSTKKPAQKASVKKAKKPTKAKVKAKDKKVKSASKPKAKDKSKSKEKSGKNKGKDAKKKKSKSDDFRKKATLMPKLFIYLRPPKFSMAHNINLPPRRMSVGAPPPRPPRRPPDKVMRDRGLFDLDVGHSSFSGLHFASSMARPFPTKGYSPMGRAISHEHTIRQSYTAPIGRGRVLEEESISIQSRSTKVENLSTGRGSPIKKHEEIDLSTTILKGNDATRTTTVKKTDINIDINIDDANAPHTNRDELEKEHNLGL